jgi:hypothetical protein
MVPADIGDNGRNTYRNSLGLAALKQESLQDMFITCEWEPSYKIVPDKVTAKVWFQVKYASWADPTDDEKENGLGFTVKPAVEFKFAPNATITLFDEVNAVQQAEKGLEREGLKNTIGLRFSLGF